MAGTGTCSYAGDGGLATSAQINAMAVAVDAGDNLYIADYDNYVVRRVTPARVISTVAGSRRGRYPGDGGLALLAQLDPFRLAVDRSGNTFVTDALADTVRKLTAQTPAGVSLSAGNNQTGTAGRQLPTLLTVKVVGPAFPLLSTYS